MTNREEIQKYVSGQIGFDEIISIDDLKIRVQISQFYGIEINDFAVAVARTALWIAENQMMREAKKILGFRLDLRSFLPLKSHPNINEGNALRIDWNDIVSNKDVNYIMGNPPFVGQTSRTKSQSDDIISVFGAGSPETKLDYVIGWYQKAVDYMKSTRIIAAFISTNSICQGESVPTFWKSMSEQNVEIQFAVRSFLWENEASEKASVFCVIIGFTAYKSTTPKIIFENDIPDEVSHINGYLLSAQDVWIISRTNRPSYNLPKMIKGSEPADGGYFFFTKQNRDLFLKKYPELNSLIHPFVGGKEFMGDKAGQFSRYCLWLKDVSPAVYSTNKEIMGRLKRIKEARESSSADRIRKMAIYPFLFCQDRQPSTNYLVFPQHTSSERKYIPIGYMNPDVIVGNACYVIPELSLYHFGVLTSCVHMAWIKIVSGRIGMGYRYSPSVYNNFPWPNATSNQKSKIEITAKRILDSRLECPDASLSNLYTELSMPPLLQQAHQENDRAVLDAYGFLSDISESELQVSLVKMYNKEKR